VWERCWDDVKTCSDRCKSERKKQLQLDRRPLEADERRAAAAGPPAEQGGEGKAGKKRQERRRRSPSPSGAQADAE
jgi:hypothetical protein